MIGLIVARGFPRTIIFKDVILDPVVRFQWSKLDAYVKDEGHSLTQVVALGVMNEELIQANHPALEQAFGLMAKYQELIVVDNYARLFDRHNWESAQGLHRSLQGAGIQVYCALRNARVSALENEALKLLLADRLHQQEERRAVTSTRKEFAAYDWVGKPQIRPSSKEKMKAINAQAHERFIMTQVNKVCHDLQNGGKEPPFSVATIVEALNGQSIKTSRGREWTPANLRRLLRACREKAPDGALFKLLKLPAQTKRA